MTCVYVGLARTIYIYGVYTVFLAEESLNIRSYTVHIYGSGQPYKCVYVCHSCVVHIEILSLRGMEGGQAPCLQFGHEGH